MTAYPRVGREQPRPEPGSAGRRWAALPAGVPGLPLRLLRDQLPAAPVGSRASHSESHSCAGPQGGGRARTEPTDPGLPASQRRLRSKRERPGAGRAPAGTSSLRVQSRPGGGAVSRAPASPRCPARLGQSPRGTPASPCSLRGLRGCCVQITPGQSRGAPGSLHSPSPSPFCGAQPRPSPVPHAEAEQADEPGKPS